VGTGAEHVGVEDVDHQRLLRAGFGDAQQALEDRQPARAAAHQADVQGLLTICAPP
jgi:hypothetical protein